MSRSGSMSRSRSRSRSSSSSIGSSGSTRIYVSLAWPSAKPLYCLMHSLEQYPSAQHPLA